jgi:hypothetical protein
LAERRYDLSAEILYAAVRPEFQSEASGKTLLSTFVIGSRMPKAQYSRSWPTRQGTTLCGEGCEQPVHHNALWLVSGLKVTSLITLRGEVRRGSSLTTGGRKWCGPISNFAFCLVTLVLIENQKICSDVILTLSATLPAGPASRVLGLIDWGTIAGTDLRVVLRCASEGSCQVYPFRSGRESSHHLRVSCGVFRTP